MTTQAAGSTPLDIAIVGLGGVFPGAGDIDDFWRNIAAGIDASREVPPGRWPVEPAAVLSDGPVRDRVYATRGCFVESIPEIDAAGLKLPAGLLNRLDPMHRITLAAGVQAFRDARTDKLDRSRAGVVLAAIALPTDGSSRLTRELFEHVARGEPFDLSPADAAAARVSAFPAALLSEALGLGGQCYTLDAACASSLYAIKLACDELTSGRADTMLAGGVSRPDALFTQMGFSQLRALSPSGRCRPFDQAADGLLVGEGAGVVLLKRLEDARRDGDRIHGVIRGIGLSNDIGGSLLAPDSEGQLRAMRAAYRQTGWSPRDVDLIECHGTGTPLGDAAELRAMRTLWSEEATEHTEGTENQAIVVGECRPCVIGSVKSNVGHLLTGAGAAGLIKVLLAMRAGVLPPSANVDRPAQGLAGGDGDRGSGIGDRGGNIGVPPVNEGSIGVPPVNEGSIGVPPVNEGSIGVPPAPRTPFRVLSEAQHWQRRSTDAPRRAAISAFGFGGINAHLLIEEAEHRRPAGTGEHRHPDRTGEHRRPAGANSADAIAIVGLALGAGADQSKIQNPKSKIAPRPPLRWRESENALPESLITAAASGDFMPHLDVPIGRFRLPPCEIPEILPQQLLMLMVAAEAMEDAGQPLRGRRERAGAIVGAAFDYEATNFHVRWTAGIGNRDSGIGFGAPRFVPSKALSRASAPQGGDAHQETPATSNPIPDPRSPIPPLTPARTLGALGNIIASRIAREFDFGGPSYAVYAEETSGLQALKIAVEALRRGELDLALAGAVDLAGDVRAMLIAAAGASGGDESTRRNADGACAVVLKRLADAERDGETVYAVIDDVSIERPRNREEQARSHGSSAAGLAALLADVERSPTAGRFTFASRDGVVATVRYTPRVNVRRSKPDEARSTKLERTIRVPIGGPALLGVGRRKSQPSAPVVAEQGGSTRLEEPPRHVAASARVRAPLLEPLLATAAATADAHDTYLRFSQEAGDALSRAFVRRRELAAMLPGEPSTLMLEPAPGAVPATSTPPAEVPTSFTREQCLEFARGSIARVLGPLFAEADKFATRVRLPDEPLMLVDRILSVDAEPKSRARGTLVTEHDVLPGAWYLDHARAPVCISVEAGQADLFLSGYLGIDFVARGVRMYRLLDATVEFHRRLPRPGETIRYAIEIERFIRQGETWLFAFRFEGSIAGDPLISMTGGRAGFFTAEEVRNSGGIVLKPEQLAPRPGKRQPDWRPLAPLGGVESYDDAQLEALRRGDLPGCFGEPFDRLDLKEPIRLPGGTRKQDESRVAAARPTKANTASLRLPVSSSLSSPTPPPTGSLQLIDRILDLDPAGGRYGLGRVRAEADVRPDDWYLTCHFVDDMTMPGTLMYEYCMQALRVLLMRIGWIGEDAGAGYEPIAGVKTVMSCRGPVTPETRKVVYQVDIKEIGYRMEGDRGSGIGDRMGSIGVPPLSGSIGVPPVRMLRGSEIGHREEGGDAAIPYALADALMFADGKRIVRFDDMSICLPDMRRGDIEALWERHGGTKARGHEGEHRRPAGAKQSFNVHRGSDATGSVSVQTPVPDPRSPIPPIRPIGGARTQIPIPDPRSPIPPIRPIGDRPVPTSAAPAILDHAHILAFAVGNPSEAFGEPYRVFDSERRIARLPGPPYCFVTRVTHIAAEPFELKAGGWAEMQYDVPPDGWYFASNRTRSMPFAVLLEAALQPCGWLAAYAGSALHSNEDLSFRNLGGTATQYEDVLPDAGTLTMRTRMTNVSKAGGMIIEEFDLQIWRQGRIVYDGKTSFGFFSATALARQVGIRKKRDEETERRRDEVEGAAGGRTSSLRLSVSPSLSSARMPDRRLRMIDEIEAYDPNGGTAGLGSVRGAATVDPSAWFFKAHFHQDPVWPGSLGLESFLQLLKVAAIERWGESLGQTHTFGPLLGEPHTWTYRGQILPTNRRVIVEASITSIEDSAEPAIRGCGHLYVDGLCIYEMRDFGLRLIRR